MIPRSILSSDAWALFQKHLNDELRAAREQNDDNLDLVETARLRGRIDFIKELLALEQSSSLTSFISDQIVYEN